jgi:hypothetical protein
MCFKLDHQKVDTKIRPKNGCLDCWIDFLLEQNSSESVNVGDLLDIIFAIRFDFETKIEEERWSNEDYD